MNDRVLNDNPERGLRCCLCPASQGAFFVKKYLMLGSLPLLTRWAGPALLGLLACVISESIHRSVAWAVSPPNFVLILADDLGWADAGCYGNRFNETPAIDRLAAEGLRWSQFYAGPVCSPTRANIQSGQDQARFGITQHIPGHRRPFAKLIDPVVPRHLPLEVETFAERLTAAGYASGYFGKWHLGAGDFGPQAQGWQEVFESKGNQLPPRITGESKPVRTTEYLTTRAIDFMRRHQQLPFVVQISHNAVHIPLSTTAQLLEKYQRKPAQPGYPSLPEYAGLVEELDQSVGRLVAEVDRLGLGTRTLVLFVSDNGGLETQQDGRIVTSNHPLREEKGTLYEGGIRVPGIARWTATIPAGIVSDQPTTTIDIYPTLLQLAGLQPNPGHPLDGASFAGQWQTPQQPPQHDALYWHLPHYHHSTPASAIRAGQWKLIEFFEDSRLELYNLHDDLGEQHDLAASEPSRAEALRQQLAAWRQDVGAAMPVPNPDYDPTRADQLGGKRP